MKVMIASAWKWVLAGVLLAALGLLLVLPWGRKRGTRLYRTRINLWSRLLMLVPMSALILSSQSGCKEPKASEALSDENPRCYKPAIMKDVTDTVEEKDTTIVAPDTRVGPQPKCYDRAEPMPEPPALQPGTKAFKGQGDDPKPEPVIMCYDAPPPPKVQPPEPQPTCYEPVDPTIEPDVVEQKPDVVQPVPVPPDPIPPTCYAPMPIPPEKPEK